MKNTALRARIGKLAGITASMVLVLGIATQRAYADQYYDYAVKMVQQRNFKVAAQYLDMRLKTNPNDSYAQYYRALCFHVANQMEEARGLYQSVIANGSDSNVKAMAANQLRRIEAISSSTATLTSPMPSRGGAAAAPPAPSDDDDDDSARPTIVPANSKAYFSLTPGHDDINVEGAVNKRRLTFCFDTGASVTMMGKNHLRELGIHPPTTRATGKIGGIGGTIDSWTMKLDISIGGITKRLPVRIAEEWDHAPLLGQDFFSDIDYEIDNVGHCIRFSKSSDIVKDDPYTIPFSRIGKHLFVQVEGEKGKKTQMIVDTGAEGILLSPTNVRELGVDTSGGSLETHRGVGGTTEAVGVVLDMLRLGPIVVRNVKVSADTGQKGMVGKEGSSGLLGQAFFSGWRFTIDNRNQRLRFFH